MLSKRFIFNALLLITPFAHLYPFDRLSNKSGPGMSRPNLVSDKQRKSQIKQFLDAQQNVFGYYLDFQGAVNNCGRMWFPDGMEEPLHIKTIAADRNLKQGICCYHYLGVINKTLFWDLENNKPYLFEEVGYAISAAAFNPENNNQAATASYDANFSHIKVDLWDVTDRSKPCVTFTPHTQMVTGLVFNDNTLYSCSLDGSIYCYDIENPAERLLIQDAQARITCMTINAAGTYLITGGKDNIARIWDVTTGIEIESFNCSFNVFNPEAEAIIPEELPDNHIINTVVISNNNKIAFIGSSNGTALLWNLDALFNPAEKWDHLILAPHSGIPSCAAFSDDSRFLLVGFTKSKLQEIRCWDLHNSDMSHGINSVLLWGAEQYAITRDATLLRFPDNTITTILREGQIVQWKLTKDKQKIKNNLESYSNDEIGLLNNTALNPKATDAALKNIYNLPQTDFEKIVKSCFSKRL